MLSPGSGLRSPTEKCYLEHIEFSIRLLPLKPFELHKVLLLCQKIENHKCI